MTAKREHSRTERKLVATLTHACEQATYQLPGFEWLTHRVDYQHFPHSLVVTWVFDTSANLSKALNSDAKQLMLALTATALAEAGVGIRDITQHVDFDSEQECLRTHNGDWKRRLRSTTTRP